MEVWHLPVFWGHIAEPERIGGAWHWGLPVTTLLLGLPVGGHRQQ